jgi:protein ImuA
MGGRAGIDHGPGLVSETVCAYSILVTAHDPDLFSAAAAAPAAPALAASASPAASPAAPPPAFVQPASLPASVWRAHELGRPAASGGGAGRVVSSGHHLLDAQLPGGGWPVGALSEWLLPHDGLGELRLLAPALAAVQRRPGQGPDGLAADHPAPRGLMWFDPPAEPCAWVLAALGIDLKRLVLVRPRPAVVSVASALRPGARRARHAERERLPATDVLWALEQALKSGQLGAIVAWLPTRLPADALRRLQLAAQAHEGPVFLLRRDPHATEAARPSPAPLRLHIRAAGADRLRVQVFKRRGAPCTEPIELQLPPVLPEPPSREPWHLPWQELATLASPGAHSPRPPGRHDPGLQAA